MSKKPRIEYADAIYHTISRTDHGKLVFNDNTDRDVFLQSVGKVCEKTGWKRSGLSKFPD